MTIQKKTTRSLTIILSFILSTSLAIEYPTMYRDWLLERKYGLVMKEPITLGKNNEFAYAECENTPKNIINCTINHEEFFVDGATPKRVCRVFLRVERNYKLTLHVQSFFNKKVLIVILSADLGYDKLDNFSVLMGHRLIDMSDCTDTRNRLLMSETFDYTQEGIRLAHQAINPQVLHHEGSSYDIFYYNPSSCNAARCLYHVDTEGLMEQSPTPYISIKFAKYKIKICSAGKIGETFALIEGQPSYDKRGYYIPDYNFQLIHVVENNGRVVSQKTLMQMNNRSRIFDSDDSYGNLTIGWIDKRTVNKLFYRIIGGNAPFKAEIEVPFEIKNFKIKNTQGGGFILMIEEKGNNRYYLRNIKHDHTLSEILLIENITQEYPKERIPTKGVETMITVDDEKNFCLSLTYKMQIEQQDKWKLIRKCFSGEHLEL